MFRFERLGLELPYILAIPFFFAVWFLLGWLVKTLFFVWLKQLTKKTETDIDDIVIEAASKPVLMMLVITGLSMIFNFMTPVEIKTHLIPFVPLALKVSSLFVLVIFVDQLVTGLFQSYSKKYDVLKISQGLLNGIVRILVYSIGILIIIDSIGISITPIVASLGIGSLAIALALQPTLENFFSGLQIIIDRPVLPGQFIKLESGEEGFVEKIGWRSTWVRQLPNNMVIIPNKQLVNSRVLNYCYPTKDMALPIEVGVHYSSDLAKVEKIAIDVGEAIMKANIGGISDFKPLVRYHTFADSSINLSVVLRVREFTDGGLVRHEFIKALANRFRQEGVVIPYPIRALNTEQEKAVF